MRRLTYKAGSRVILDLNVTDAQVVALVKGVAWAQRAVNDFTEHLTEAEKKSGIFFCWEYTSSRIGRRMNRI